MKPKTLTIQLNDEQLPILPVEPEAHLSFTTHADGKMCIRDRDYTEEEMNAVEEHIQQYFGKFENVFHELDSPDIHVDIRCV